MHLVYSALKPNNKDDFSISDQQTSEKMLRYSAYLAVCEKYCREIAAIRKYFPNWSPEFR